ncbi:sensor domain-containing diguanylate cyclase/phosphohydrolase [Pleomorphochaeta sp. DL1XJH-081]|uniref:sensor domain-containing diguanylate cyclase/phosphohydrolase n=1 Tax=Pleomorphochaeta sp. DL1XJH-081 TaxID=3409690 RepID=UPI003BB4D858
MVHLCSGEGNRVVDKEFYRKIIIESSIGYAYAAVVTDNDGNPTDLSLIEVNDALAKLVGMQKTDFEGKNLSTCLPQIQGNEFNWIASVGRVGLTGISQHVVQRVDYVDRWFSVRVSCPEKGKIVVLINDVTAEVKRTRLYEGIVNLTPVLIFVIDFEGKIIIANDEWTHILGYPKQSLLGSHVFDYIHPEDIESTVKVMEDLDENRVIRNFVNRYRNFEGSFRSLEWRAHVSDGLIYGSARDITERMATEKQKQRELDLMNLLFDQTLTGMFMMMLEEPVDWDQASDKDALLDSMMEDLLLVKTNQAFLEQFGTNAEHVAGMSLSELFSNNLETTKQVWRELMDQGKTSQEFEGRKFDGTPIWIRGDYHCLYNSKRQIVGNFGMQLDISDRRLSEVALKRSERRYRLIAEHASDVIWVYDVEKRAFVYLSPSVRQFLGYEPEELIEKPVEFSLYPQDVERIKKKLGHMILEFSKHPKLEKRWKLQMRQVKRDGSVIWAEASINFRLKRSQKVEAIGVSRDVTTRKRNEERILHLSYRDQLTGLYNRRYYEERQTILCSDERYMPLSVVVCDVNGLKLTNDVFGHQMGDQLLVTCANSLLAVNKQKDIIARIGGDEFVVLMAKTSQEEALERIEGMRQEIADKQVGKTRLSVSFGCATAYKTSDSFEAIFKQAEDIMYRQKLLESSSYKHDVIKVLIHSLYDKGRYEKDHSEHVGALCIQLGREMGFPPAEVDDLRLAGMLHDIGKIGISQELLNQKRQLSDQEWSQMRRHPEMGFQILRSVQNFGHIADWILAHHEQPDGKGYPRGLTDTSIPLQAKIIAVANAFDSMTSPSGYRQQPLSIDEALRELDRCSGTQFDPSVVKAFHSLPISYLSDPTLQKEELFDESV